MIIIVFGLPGSGKTYFSRRLAERIGGHHISSDAIRKEIVPSPTYTESEKVEVYKKMYDIMYDYVHRKEHLILDGTFYKAALRDNFIAEMARLGKDIKFIEIRADVAIVKERLKGARENSDADFVVYKQIESEFEPYLKEHLVLNSTNENIEEMIAAGLEYLDVKAHAENKS